MKTKAQGYTFERKGSRIIATGRGEPAVILPASTVARLAANASKLAAHVTERQKLLERIDALDRQIDTLEIAGRVNCYDVELREDGGVDFGCTHFPARDVKRIAALAK